MHRLTFVFLAAFWPAVAVAQQTERVLSLCLDTTKVPETRVAELLSDGWTKGGDKLEALTVAITLIRINAGDPADWNEDRDFARLLAERDLNKGDTETLTAPDGSILIVGRDRIRLQTCLYLGKTLDMAPLDAALDGSFVRQIREVFRIRGEGYKSLVSAHGISEAGRNLFDPPLAFAMSFATRLDRQARD